MEKLIDRAKKAIGSDSLDDYKITPTNFPNGLDQSAPEISKILRHSSFDERAKRYELHDTTAISAQKKFKNYALQATWAICTAAISGSFLAGLSAAKLAESSSMRWPLFLLGLISTIGGVVAIYRLHQLVRDKLLEKWMTARAKAETERLGYFNSLSRYIVENARSEVYLHLLFVCMFKRYQLEVQRLYYASRADDHLQSLTKTTSIGAVAALCLALGSGTLGMIGAFVTDLLPFAAMGTIGAAISVLASRREDLNQDERNSERYGRTADILSKIAERHDDVLSVASKGNNPEIIIKYVDAVNDQLSLEHRQWASDASEMSSALSALEESVSELHQEK